MTDSMKGIESPVQAREKWEAALAKHYKTGRYLDLGIAAQDSVPIILERLDAVEKALMDLVMWANGCTWGDFGIDQWALAHELTGVTSTVNTQ